MSFACIRELYAHISYRATRDLFSCYLLLFSVFFPRNLIDFSCLLCLIFFFRLLFCATDIAWTRPICTFATTSGTYCHHVTIHFVYHYTFCLLLYIFFCFFFNYQLMGHGPFVHSQRPPYLPPPRRYTSCLSLYSL